MCSRYYVYMPDGSRVSIEDFVKQFPGNPIHVLRWVKKIFNQRSRPEVRPRDDVPVITADGGAEMNWWFVPEHARDAFGRPTAVFVTQGAASTLVSVTANTFDGLDRLPALFEEVLLQPNPAIGGRLS